MANLHRALSLPRRLKPRQRLFAVVGLVAVAGLMLLAFTRGGNSGEQGALQAYQVREAPFVITQSFAGRIAPGEQVEVVANAEATVLEVGFNFGERVEEGQVLYRLNPDDLWRKQAEAQIGYVQASDAARRMAQWSDGPEMRRSIRAVEAAQTKREESQRKQEDGARLFSRGLISRTEMEGLDSSLRQSEQALEVAREDLAQTIAKGTGPDRTVTRLQQGLAASRLGEVNSTSEAVIRAGRTGVIVRPRASTLGADNSGPKVGGKVTAGQSLGVIAALDGLDVVFRVDEADLALLEAGVRAQVTGPGFAGQVLQGRLLEVAGEADTGTGDKTQFEARVRLDALSPEVARRLRIGMTAQVALTLYESERALAVPVAALDASGHTVRVRKPDGTVETRQITLGRIGPDQAEVVSGLKAGETVVWPRSG